MKYTLTLVIDSDTIDGLFSEMLWVLHDEHRRHAYLRQLGREAEYPKDGCSERRWSGNNHGSLRITERKMP